MTRMISQLSQPSWSISSRDIGRNGAGPKQAAQYWGHEKKVTIRLDQGNCAHNASEEKNRQKEPDYTLFIRQI